MNEVYDHVEIKITKMGNGWFDPRLRTYKQVPEAAYEKLLELVLAWEIELQGKQP